jgi:hypothetical protein
LSGCRIIDRDFPLHLAARRDERELANGDHVLDVRELCRAARGLCRHLDECEPAGRRVRACRRLLLCDEAWLGEVEFGGRDDRERAERLERLREPAGVTDRDDRQPLGIDVALDGGRDVRRGDLPDPIAVGLPVIGWQPVQRHRQHASCDGVRGLALQREHAR